MGLEHVLSKVSAKCIDPSVRGEKSVVTFLLKNRHRISKKEK